MNRFNININIKKISKFNYFIITLNKNLKSIMVYNFYCEVFNYEYIIYKYIIYINIKKL